MATITTGGLTVMTMLTSFGPLTHFIELFWIPSTVGCSFIGFDELVNKIDML